MQDTINIAGQTFPIKWNFKAVTAYEKATGESYYNIPDELSKAFAEGESLKATVIIGLIYAAIIGGGGRISEDLILANITNIEQDVMEKVMALYYDSMPKTDPTAQPSQAPAEPVGELIGQPSKDGLA